MIAPVRVAQTNGGNGIGRQVVLALIRRGPAVAHFESRILGQGSWLASALTGSAQELAFEDAGGESRAEHEPDNGAESRTRCSAHEVQPRNRRLEVPIEDRVVSDGLDRPGERGINESQPGDIDSIAGRADDVLGAKGCTSARVFELELDLVAS